MATYLYMDGVDDYLQTPVLDLRDITKIELDLEMYTAEKFGSSWILFTAFKGNSNFNGFRWDRTTSNTDRPQASYFPNVYIDGILQSWNTEMIKNEIRHFVALEVTPDNIPSPHTFDVRFFDSGSIPRANVYSMKLYNVGGLLAHYDMSTGTALDQSGNGNHATLVGGTWLDDGVGGDTGTTDSIQYDTKNIIYDEHSFQSDLQQKLYKLSSLKLDTTQKLFTVDATNYDTAQVIYKTSSILYDTLQNIFDGGLIGSVSYDLKLQLYAQGSQLNDTKAEIYKLHEDIHSLHQAICKASSTDSNIHLILYADNSKKYDMAQSIYQENVKVNYDTKQTIFDPTNSVIGIIKLSGQRDLYVHLVGKRELSVNLTGKRELEIRLKGGV